MTSHKERDHQQDMDLSCVGAQFSGSHIQFTFRRSYTDKYVPESLPVEVQQPLEMNNPAKFKDLGDLKSGSQQLIPMEKWQAQTLKEEPWSPISSMKE
jgi:hypothetical protein